MGTSSAAQAGPYSYLRPCPKCSADNGVTAEQCWRCEAMLGYLRPPRRAVAPAADPQAHLPGDAEPSFFPVLREEVPGEEAAANDGLHLDSSAFEDDELPQTPVAPRRPARRLAWPAAGAVLAAIALWLVVFDDPGPPAPVAALPAPPMLPGDGAMTRTVYGGAPAVSPDPAKVEPSQTSCTAAVVALGLCAGGSN